MSGFHEDANALQPRMIACGCRVAGEWGCV